MRHLLLFCLLIVALIASAQQRPVTDLTSQPKWEVGTDLLGLIDKNTLPKYSLLIRRQMGQHGAIRLRGGYQKDPTYLSWRQANNNTSSLIRIGYEYQKPLSSLAGSTKSLIYGGIDVFSRYEKDYVEDYVTPYPAPYVGTGTAILSTTREKGGAIFIGFKYFLTHYLSLSVESSFQISQVRYSQRETAFLRQYDYVIDFLPRSDIQFLPINTVNLSFHF